MSTEMPSCPCHAPMSQVPTTPVQTWTRNTVPITDVLPIRIRQHSRARWPSQSPDRPAAAGRVPSELRRGAQQCTPRCDRVFAVAVPRRAFVAAAPIIGLSRGRFLGGARAPAAPPMRRLPAPWRPRRTPPARPPSTGLSASELAETAWGSLQPRGCSVRRLEPGHVRRLLLGRERVAPRRPRGARRKLPRAAAHPPHL